MPDPEADHVCQILVVDDEPDLRELLVDALSDMDVKVHTAATGAEAVRLARKQRPDLVVTDLFLGDSHGLEVLDDIRLTMGEVPAVVITGHRDASVLTRASRRRPVELMTKPLDLDRLRNTIREELRRQATGRKASRRTHRWRSVAHKMNHERKAVHHQLETTCADLTDAYRSLSGQMALQQVVLGFQRELLAAKNDDDVFRSLFRLFVRRSGAVFGVAMVCDGDAELQIIGRFGVPGPDGATFCRSLCEPLIQDVLADPRCHHLDAGDHAERFDEDIREFLVGITTLAIPLLPGPGEMIGLVVLYRKGEQPFTEDDLALAELLGPPAATAVRRND